MLHFQNDYRNKKLKKVATENSPNSLPEQQIEFITKLTALAFQNSTYWQTKLLVTKISFTQL